MWRGVTPDLPLSEVPIRAIMAPLPLKRKPLARTERTRGRSARRFRYVDKGNMATIGRRSAVAELPFGAPSRAACSRSALGSYTNVPKIQPVPVAFQ